jgi:6-phosphogluconolactonase/glucosamine-6-phosphate isomerase/deaminase
VVFLVAGESKRRVLGEILSDPQAAARRFPAAAVRPASGPAWFVDARAAGAVP